MAGAMVVATGWELLVVEVETAGAAWAATRVDGWVVVMVVAKEAATAAVVTAAATAAAMAVVVMAAAALAGDVVVRVAKEAGSSHSRK